MTISRLSTLLLCTLLCVSVVPQAQAFFWYLGDTETGGSWGQQFVLTDVGTFDYMRVDLIPVSGQSEFEAPAFRDFSSVGWGSRNDGGSLGGSGAGRDPALLQPLVHAYA